MKKLSILILFYAILFTSCESVTKVEQKKLLEPKNDILLQQSVVMGQDTTGQNDLTNNNFNSDPCDDDITQIIPCKEGPSPTPIGYTLRIVTPNITFEAQDDRGTQAIADMDNLFGQLFGGLEVEILGALIDINLRDGLDQIPIGIGDGFDEHFGYLPIFYLNHKAKFITNLSNSNLNLALTLYDFNADLKLESTKWYTTDAKIDAHIDKANIGENIQYFYWPI